MLKPPAKSKEAAFSSKNCRKCYRNNPSRFRLKQSTRTTRFSAHRKARHENSTQGHSHLLTSPRLRIDLWLVRRNAASSLAERVIGSDGPRVADLIRIRRYVPYHSAAIVQVSRSLEARSSNLDRTRDQEAGVLSRTNPVMGFGEPPHCIRTSRNRCVTAYSFVFAAAANFARHEYR